MATIAELRKEIRGFAEGLLAKHGVIEGREGVALFTLIEDIACEVGDSLAQEVMRQAIQQDESATPCCPRCGQPGLRKNERTRVVASRRGPVEVPEVECYCKRCRKSFFPSLGTTGAGSGLRLQSTVLGEAGVCGSELE